MKLLASQHIDKRKWDQMVASDAQLDFFSLSWVWDILHPDWEMLCDEEGNYLGPVPIASKFGMSYRLQPFFIRSLNFRTSTNEFFGELIHFLATSARYIHLNVSNLREERQTSLGQFQLLDLSPSLEELRAAYSTNAKRLLKKIPEDYHLEMLDSPEDFVSFFKAQKGEELEGFSEAVWNRLTELLKAAQNEGLLSIYALRKETQILACGAFISYKGIAYFLKGTATPQAKKDGAMYFLMDEVISLIQPSHKHLDFVGSNNEAIAQFYRKFGAKNHAYSVLKQNNLPGIFKWIKA